MIEGVDERKPRSGMQGQMKAGSSATISPGATADTDLMNYNLASPFYESALESPNAIAINADGEEFTYREILERVRKASGWLHLNGTAPKRVGILASRSVEACIGILASAWVGAAYVPINLTLPKAALLEILKRSRLDALIADRQGSQLLSPDVLMGCPARILAYRHDAPEEPQAINDYQDVAFISGVDPTPMDSSDTGYILYTSGSTGVPKGVVVPVGAVEHLLRVLDNSFAVRPDDRVAETTAPTFDLSVYNMFAAWRAGASLHIVPTKQAMAPLKFIQDHEITVWLSVPSIANLMSRMNLLKPGAFPSLRQTFFAGEPLVGSVAAEWQKAAPATTVANMYGPTEATVICIGENFGPSCAMTRDMVAIGRPFTGMKASVATPELSWVPNGVNGELLLSGPQLALGYLDDPEKTAAKFVYIDGERWYRTGDLALRDDAGVIHYLGRIDNQVKVLGYRIELEDIESHLRAVTGRESLACIPWPVRDGSATGIVAFVAGFDGSAAEVKEKMKERVPPHMVPSHIRSILELPLNTNGKIDRKMLAEILTQ
jgi:D-alanine--poly(phosphoribitol) ligase subunit 1